MGLLAVLGVWGADRKWRGQWEVGTLPWEPREEDCGPRWRCRWRDLCAALIGTRWEARKAASRAGSDATLEPIWLITRRGTLRELGDREGGDLEKRLQGSLKSSRIWDMRPSSLRG